MNINDGQLEQWLLTLHQLKAGQAYELDLDDVYQAMIDTLGVELSVSSLPPNEIDPDLSNEEIAEFGANEMETMGDYMEADLMTVAIHKADEPTDSGTNLAIRKWIAYWFQQAASKTSFNIFELLDDLSIRLAGFAPFEEQNEYELTLKLEKTSHQ